MNFETDTTQETPGRPATAPPGSGATSITAAAHSSAQIIIAASAERVWDLLTDIDRWPHWNRAVSSAQLRGSLAADSVFVWRSQGLTVTSTLTQVHRAARLVWTGRAFGTRALHVWEIEPDAHGVMVKTYETFDGWLPRLMPRAMQRKLDETLPAWLGALKTAAEAAPRARAANASTLP